MALRPKLPVSPRTAWGKAFEGSFEAGISVAVGVVLGYYADRWLGTEPYLLFFFLIVGAIAGFQRLLRIATPPATGSPGDPRQDSDESEP